MQAFMRVDPKPSLILSGNSLQEGAGASSAGASLGRDSSCTAEETAFSIASEGELVCAGGSESMLDAASDSAGSSTASAGALSCGVDAWLRSKSIGKNNVPMVAFTMPLLSEPTQGTNMYLWLLLDY